jgi:Uncharacterized stress-induced protein
MIRSMTGFAERNFTSSSLRVKIFIKSLNHRFFDWVYKGENIGDLENQLRAACQKRILRGRVEVLLELNYLSPERWEFSINRALLRKMVGELKNLSAEVALPFSLNLDQLLRVPQLVNINQKELTREDRNYILSAFEKALEDIVKQREKEGREIARQLNNQGIL